MIPDKPGLRPGQPKSHPRPVCSRDVDDAYKAYAAMRRIAQAEPHLASNDYFTALQDTAYARFLLTFEAL